MPAAAPPTAPQRYLKSASGAISSNCLRDFVDCQLPSRLLLVKFQMTSVGDGAGA
jgi:hypothetical protein